MENNDWKIELMRLTIFVEEDFNSKNLEDWLIKISSQDPIQINKTGATFLGISKLESSFLKLEWKQNRIDLIINADIPEVENNIGEFSMFNKYCDEYILKYFDMDGCPTSNRIGFGVILYVPIKDNIEGMERLKRFLKSVNIIEEAGDFLYRINIPLKSSKDNEIEINRLVTWHVGVIKILRMDIKPNLKSYDQTEEASGLVCRVEMDLNTVQNSEVKMPVVQQKKIVTTLIDIANGIAESGENSF
jgi:hypothetical protein